LSVYLKTIATQLENAGRLKGPLEIAAMRIFPFYSKWLVPGDMTEMSRGADRFM
jgi:hypothetical protein